ncbi:unnamed protein product [Schistocephalus solidus]|uniref:Phospholipid scramblase n=1 Tax=Schistocephalus solidus TaxID=70667 RepID=A0A183SSS1_SCHSO|nr:unnamed protein product [Schistocephalus solidus]
MPVALLVYPSEENPHKAKDRLPRCYLVIGDQPERQSPSIFERPNLTTSSTWPDQKFYETRSDAKAMDYFSSQVDRCGTEADNLPIACSHMTAVSSQGLACLRNLSKIFIHQQIQLLEVFSNWEATNRYIVKNSRGQRLLYATEESDICTRQCCGHQRSFVIRMLDEHNFEVARATRQFSCAVSLTSCHLCCCCFCWGFCAEQKAIGNSSAASTTGISSLAATCRRALCWLVHRCDCSERFMQSLLVESPPGQVIGRVQEEYVSAGCLFFYEIRTKHIPPDFIHSFSI